MREMDAAHVSTWLHCLTASTCLEDDLDSTTSTQPTGLMDLPTAYGGIGFLSFERAADEELLDSFSTYLIAFCHKTEFLVYIAIAEALKTMGDVANHLDKEEHTAADPIKSMREIREVVARSIVHTPSDDELVLATQLIRGHTVVEVPG